MSAADLPLDGLVVVDMSQFLSGPYCSLRLLDLGARVIKVERPDGGDLSRHLYLSDTEIGGDSTIFHAINRAKESPREIEPRQILVRSERRVDGYTLEAFLPADILTGYSPADQPQLGFTYALFDRELGTQTFSIGVEFPIDEDPSLWGTLDLVK